MRTIFIDQLSILQAVNAVSHANGIIDVVERNEYILTCVVDDKGFKALRDAGVPFTGGQEEPKKAPKKEVSASVEKIVPKKKSLPSSTK